MDVNALNYCRFSLLPLHHDHSLYNATGRRALISVPNLVESSVVWKQFFRAIFMAAMLIITPEKLRQTSGHCLLESVSMLL